MRKTGSGPQSVGRRWEDRIGYPAIVLATVPGYPVAAWDSPYPDTLVRVRNHQATPPGWLALGCYPDKTYSSGCLAGFELICGSNLLVPTTVATIKYLSSDHIMIWSVRILCSSQLAFTTSLQICDPFNIHWVALKYGLCWGEIWGFSVATAWEVRGSQICNREVKEQLELNNLRTAHVAIRSDLKFLIADKVMVLKCQVLCGSTGQIATVRVYVW